MSIALIQKKITAIFIRINDVEMEIEPGYQ